MAYVIRNRDTGRYVAEPGNAKSYTTKDKARRFPTKESAERECCGNETAIPAD